MQENHITGCNRRIGRREFLQATGLAGAALVLGQTAAISRDADDHVTTPAKRTAVYDNLEQVKSRNGQVLVRLEIRGDKRESRLAGRLKVMGAKVTRVKEYFFEAGRDEFARADNSWTCTLPKQDSDIVVLWLDQTSADTRLQVRGQRYSFTFSLAELLAVGQIDGEIDSSHISANFLLDKELGAINLRQIGAEEPGENFDFVIFADPQGGDPTDTTNDSPARIRIHNPFIVKSIELVNQLQPKPAFVLVLGDIVDSQGQRSNFDAMLRFLSSPLRGKLHVPVLFALGNHETRYGSRFAPGYNMQPLTNYLDAQRQINGLDKIAYSFSAGRWHFVVWPDPLRRDFWQTHPHYFAWLDEDLKQNRDRPTIFFQHISLLPMGISPMINYSEKVFVKRTLLDIVTRYGNVEYAFSGHTHIPLKASFKTARTYRGTKFINLPPAGYRPRGFGEEDFDRGPSQGFAIVSVGGSKATVRFNRCTGKAYTYPQSFPKFRPDDWPLWLAEKWQLPAENRIINGDFEQGLKGWARRYVYQEDKDQSSICKTNQEVRHAGSRSLHLFCRERGAMARGQDRMPQTINRISQAIELPPDKIPVLTAWYLLDGKKYGPENNAGAYIWLQGYKGSTDLLHLVYWAGKAIPNPRGLYARWSPYVHFDMTGPPDEWHEVVINPKRDYELANNEGKFNELQLDRLVVTLGTWTENIGNNQQIGLYFDDISVRFEPENAKVHSTIDDEPIRRKEKAEIWNKRIVHVSGEHVFKERSNQ
jgi:3',5'-cyclic AMP phosphodiesterase CpdA